MKTYIFCICFLFFPLHAQEVIDLTGMPEDIRISCAHKYAGFGHRIAAGDVNGDGFQDILVGGETEETYYTAAGAGFLIFGSEQPKRFISTGDKSGITIFWGSGPQEYTAEYLACFDFNDDGLDDIFLNGPQWTYTTTPHAGRGKIYYFSGRADWDDEYFLKDEAEDEHYHIIWGQADNGHFGYRIKHGDLNGDGVDDLVTGSGLGKSTGPLNERRTVYILWGGQRIRGSGPVENLDLKITKVYQPSVPDPGMNFFVGDADGDGFDDLFVCFRETFDDIFLNGRMYVVWGRPEFPSEIELNDAETDDGVSMITSNQENSGLGGGLIIGNLNDNPVPDIITPFKHRDGRQPPPNEEFYWTRQYVSIFYDLFSVRRKQVEFFDPKLNPRILVDESDDMTFGSVGCCTDWDHDGIDDLVLGNNSASRGSQDKVAEGSVYILYGGQALGDTIRVNPPDPEYRLTVFYGGYYACSLGMWTVAGDLNRDGLDDLLFGAWGATTSAGAGAGEAYVFYNKKTQRDTVVVESVTLLNPFPNPFRLQTRFKLQLDKESDVDLNIYDMRGRLVKNLYHRQLGPGEHWAYWNGLDEDFDMVASGLYFFTVRIGDRIYAKKVIYLNHEFH